MKIELTDHKGIIVVSPSGEIDMYSSPELRKQLLSLIKKKSTPIIVALRNVTYIDSSGIATFVEALKKMMPYKGKLKITDIPESIMRIFNFSKLDKVFEMYDSIDDAIKS
ncbi:MAG: STAS domain-containing protein [Nitrospirae bacterium]|uniref:STAS domain-containing protein n=1 Tax=Candidatus Magnetobacterium casense TaxID=1455061 RepID=UPI00058BFEB2|nr:STAS domain-containing protein [Candidatus Magnetobacterium casensis]MBF0337554.1 STAS domain-containing protein [Nitrospirota bacterium]